MSRVAIIGPKLTWKSFQIQPQHRCQSAQSQERFLPIHRRSAPSSPLSMKCESPQPRERERYPPTQQSCASPPPVIRVSPQAQERFLPTRHNLIKPSIPTNSGVSNGNMDPPSTSSGSQQLKRSLPMSNTPSAKKFKSETYYDNTDRLLENENSPIYKDGTPLKVFTPLQTSLELR